MNLDRARKLLALATDDGTTEDERRTSAVALAKMMKDDDFLDKIQKVIDRMEKIAHNFSIKF
jgi:hypothetical protein